MSTRAVILPVIALLLATACEQTFEPIQTPEDLHFSVYGFLDASASADTQWVRVGGVRDGIHTDPEPIGAVVTLENLETGHTVLLRDSVSTYQLELGSELVAYNYWTTEKIEPGATYRFSVTGPDGATASATVRVPEPFPPVEVGTVSGHHYVRVEGVEHMAMVQVLHHIPPECVVGFSIFYRTFPIPDPPLEDGAHVVPLSIHARPGARPPVPCDHPVRKREIRLIASGSEWPYDPQVTGGTLAHMNVISNVENAVGYLGGVITKTIPYATCVHPGFASCWLTHGPESASLQGIVRDQHCDGRPIGDPRSVITLTDLDSGKRWSTGADGNGHYEFGMIDSGSYELHSTVPVPPPAPGYQLRVDTLDFAAGEQKVHDILMIRFGHQCHGI